MNTLDRTLELFATLEVDPSAVQDAQRKLETAIAMKVSAPAVRKPARQVGGWLAATAAAAVLAVTLWLPLASSPAMAFSQVQEHFRDFRSLRFDVEQRTKGKLILKSRTQVNERGDVRTDVGSDITVIVNNREQQVLTLVHPEHIAVLVPMAQAAPKDAALDWLGEIRDFQGKAQRLPRPRVMAGRNVYGWKLTIAGSNFTLWADESGLPLSMEVGDRGQLQLNFEFEFNAPLADELFSTQLPPGYSRAAAED